jgi:NAD(P)-dependent dehydrogenase (short-subunit alcohol dehydrogenase family)
MNNGQEVVLVTGASSGMGKETAKTLLREGYTVYTAARRVEKMEELRELSGMPIKMDITKEEEVVATVEQITQKHGGVDILINNAGFGMYGAVEDTTLDDARYQFEVNLFGLARLTQLVLPHMREKMAGKIVNTSSVGGKIYTPLGAWYHATKHALEGWSDCLRLEVQPFNIAVIIVEPGVIQTEFDAGLVGPMMKRSGHGAYADLAQAVASATESTYGNGGCTDPSVIANVILRAIRSDRPRTRYVAGQMAKPLTLARKYLGDRMFDRVIMSQVS